MRNLEEKIKLKSVKITIIIVSAALYLILTPINMFSFYQVIYKISCAIVFGVINVVVFQHLHIKRMTKIYNIKEVKVSNINYEWLGLSFYFFTLIIASIMQVYDSMIFMALLCITPLLQTKFYISKEQIIIMNRTYPLNDVTRIDIRKSLWGYTMIIQIKQNTLPLNISIGKKRMVNVVKDIEQVSEDILIHEPAGVI